MTMFRYLIPEIPPSNNKYMGNSNNFNIYRKEKERWLWLVRAAMTTKPKRPIKKAIVHINYHFKDRRRRDPDNYSGKMLLDPLVKLEVLEDDSFNNIELILSAGVDKDNPRTEITIVEKEGENAE